MQNIQGYKIMFQKIWLFGLVSRSPDPRRWNKSFFFFWVWTSSETTNEGLRYHMWKTWMNEHVSRTKKIVVFDAAGAVFYWQERFLSQYPQSRFHWYSQKRLVTRVLVRIRNFILKNEVKHELKYTSWDCTASLRNSNVYIVSTIPIAQLKHIYLKILI